MNFYRRKRRMPTVIIVSLIDIFAILLIFVIVTTTFKRPQPAVTIRLPESATASAEAQAPEVEPALLSVSEKGDVFLDEAAVPLASLPAALKAVAANHRSVALRADTHAPFGIIIQILDALKEAGIAGNLPAFTETIQKQKEN